MKLRVALVVPDLRVKDWYSPKHCQYPLLKQACANGEVDLVVLPEAYYRKVKTQKMKDVAIKEWYSYLEVPVLVGMQSTDGFQVAVFVNPDAKRTETKSHLYFKHSSAVKLAFDRDGYEGANDRMFRPIKLREERIGVQIATTCSSGLSATSFESMGRTNTLTSPAATCQRRSGATSSLAVRLSWTHLFFVRCRNAVIATGTMRLPLRLIEGVNSNRPRPM